jgi:hypothetical protein
MKKPIAILSVVIVVAAISGALVAPKNPFVHALGRGPYPWNATPVPRQAGEFTFAIIGDLYSGERAGVFQVAVEQLRMLRPDLIMSIGDLIEGGTEDLARLKHELDSFDNRVVKAGIPFFHAGGNHDLTNPVMRKFWMERYGRTYYHFLYQDVLFLVLDSEDYNEERMWEIYKARAEAIKILDGPSPQEAQESAYFAMKERVTGEISPTQSEYFEKVLADNKDVRWTFLFMHKPVWQREAPGGLERIEKALGSRPYTLFNGHLHKYSHTLRNNRDYIMVATTSGGQDAKSDMAFDHITLVSVGKKEPSIVNLRLEGILDKAAKVPLGGDTLCFQASRCAGGVK